MSDPTTQAAGVAAHTPVTTPPAPAMEAKKEKARMPPPKRPSAQTRHSMNGPLYMQQAGSNKIMVRRAKRKDDGPIKNLARWFLENQVGLSFNLIALLFLTHFLLPKSRPLTRKFFLLSEYNPATGNYAAGINDVYFIAFGVVLLTGLRAGVMEHILAPLAKEWGLSKKKPITRFCEQAWMLFYYLVFWPMGLYLYCTSPYWLNSRELWTGFPNRELSGLMKFYLLSQWAFWVQQVLVINIEERRKDHWQMLFHHFITIALIWSCYAYAMTRVGHLIMVLMDIADIFLPLAKCLKYLGFSTLCDVTFGLFMLSWLIARHILYTIVLWSIAYEMKQVIPSSCFSGPDHNMTGPLPVPDNYSYLLEPFLDPHGPVCMNDTVRQGFLLALGALQVIMIVWFTMAIRVAIRVLSGQGADDSRSDDEAAEEAEEDDEEDEFVYEEAELREEEVGVESLDLKGWERRTGVKRQASSSGVSLPGHSDRKELLGRIGCEKQVE